MLHKKIKFLKTPYNWHFWKADVISKSMDIIGGVKNPETFFTKSAADGSYEETVDDDPDPGVVLRKVVY